HGVRRRPRLRRAPRGASRATKRRRMTMGEAVSPLGVFDDPRYAALALERAAVYQSAEPFPHTVFEDFLPVDLAHELSGAFPAFDDISWIERDNEQNRRRYQHDETRLPILLREMLRELNSRQFLLFLETLTGIDNL